MRMTAFPDGAGSDGLAISELGFGCAAVAGRVSRKDSLRALHLAHELGVTLYDTARSYGYGQSESVVGEFLEGRRDRVVLCTKFGIMPAARGGWKQKVKPLAQAGLRLFPGLRAMARKHVGDQFVANQFTPEILRQSFETSLRELKTDYVDLLLMHAAPATVLEQDDLLEALGRLVEAGKARMAGISGELPVMEAYFAAQTKPLTTAQFALNLGNLGFMRMTRQVEGVLLVGNHPFGGPDGAAAGKAMVTRLGQDAGLAPELRQKLDPADPQTLPELVLNCVLRGTGLTAVVPAMMQERHIRSNIAAVERCRFTPEEIGVLQEYLMA